MTDMAKGLPTAGEEEAGSPSDLQVPGYAEILRFALPLMLGFMTTAVNTLVDTMFIGRLGTAALAAVPLAALVYIIGWVLVLGVMRNSIAFIARAHGAGRRREIGGILAHYQLLALAGLPLLVLYVQAWPVFSALGGFSREVDGLARTYLYIRVWDVTFAMLLALYSAFYQAIGNSRFPMLVSGSVVSLNIVLDYGLIFGHLGLPEMGVAGSALATVLAQAFGGVLIMGGSFLGAEKGRYGLRLLVRPERGLMRDILRIGVPQGLGDCVELAAWSGFMLIVGRLGEASLAASNIGIQATHLLFLPGFAFGIAASSYIGRFLGAGNPQGARNTALRVLLMGVGYMGVSGIPLWFFGEDIAAAFTGDPEVIRLAGLMFKVMAVYQAIDGLGFVTRTALGGAGDTRVPTLALLGFVCLVLIPSAWVLSRVVDPPMLGAWLGAFAYMAVYASFMQWRFHGGGWLKIRLSSAG